MKKFFLLILLIHHVALSYIVQSDNLATLLNFIPRSADRNGILVIFDIDNTLTKTKQDLGSDQWFFYQVEQFVQAGLSRADAVNTVLPLYNILQMHIPLKLIEAETPTLIIRLKQLGIHIIALTSRGFELINRTVEQLNNLGVNFADSSFFEGFANAQYRGKDGIIFCHGHAKDIGLLEAFKRSHYFPFLVIYVDDKENYLFCVGDMLYSNKINFYGIRYSRLDAHVAQFDPVSANWQLQEFYRTHNIIEPLMPDPKSIIPPPTPITPPTSELLRLYSTIPC